MASRKTTLKDQPRNGFAGKTVGLQLEEYQVSIKRCELLGLGLLGTIGCVAAGALEKSPVFLRNAYFVALIVAAFIVGGSHLYASSQAKKARHLIKKRKLRTNNLVGQSSYLRVYRDYVHASLCVVSFLSVGFILLGAQVINAIVWHDCSARFRMEEMACNLTLGTVVAVMTILPILLYFGSQLDPKRTVSWSNLLDDSIRDQHSLIEKIDFSNCAEFLAGTKETLRQIKLIWVVMVAQATCLSADVLEKGDGYYAISLMSIVLYAYLLGYGVYVNERAQRRVKNEIRARRLSMECFPRVAEVVALARFNPDILRVALVLPPCTLAFSIVSSMFGLPKWTLILLIWLAGGITLGNLVIRSSIPTFEEYSGT